MISHLVNRDANALTQAHVRVRERETGGRSIITWRIMYFKKEPIFGLAKQHQIPQLQISSNPSLCKKKEMNSNNLNED